MAGHNPAGQILAHPSYTSGIPVLVPDLEATLAHAKGSPVAQARYCR